MQQMLFQKKIDRAMNWLKEKNQEKDQKTEQAGDTSGDGSDGIHPEEDKKAMLEKHDLLAMFLAALLVFAPLLIIIAIIIILVIF